MSVAKGLEPLEDPSTIWLGGRFDEGTAFQRNEIGDCCLLKIFMSELYRPGRRGPSWPTIVPQKYLALYSILPGAVSLLTDEEDVDAPVSFFKVANASAMFTPVTSN